MSQMRSAFAIGIALTLITACGQDDAVSTAPSAAQVSSDSFQAHAPGRSMLNRTAAGRHVAHQPGQGYPNWGTYSFGACGNWGCYGDSYYLEQQRAYLYELMTKAEAALVKARAEARLNDAKTESLRLLTAEVESNLARLRQKLADIDNTQRQIRTHAQNVARLTTQGSMSADILTSIRYLANASGMSMQELLEIGVPALAADEFATAGAYKVVTDERGRKVFQKSTDAPFPGGNALQLLEHMQANRLNAKSGSKAHAALMIVGEKVRNAGVAWQQRLAEKSQTLRTEATAEWPKLIAALEALKDSTSGEGETETAGES